MKLIGIVFLAGIVLVCCPAPALADEASKNAKIDEMMQIMHADRMMTQMLDQMKPMLTSQLRKMDMPAEARKASEEMQQKMMALIADRLSWEKTKPAFTRIYAETFTEGDIDGILTFEVIMPYPVDDGSPREHVAGTGDPTREIGSPLALGQGRRKDRFEPFYRRQSSC